MPRLRFSLRAFLLWLFIFSLLGSNFFTAWQLRELREENAGMRKELGRLVVSDRDKINIIAVPTYEDLMWRWRIYVPEGKSLYLCESTQEIPLTGVPANFGATGVQAGEYLLTAAIRRDRQNKWLLTVATPTISGSTGFADEHAGWLSDSPGWSSEQAGSSETQVFDADQPITLLRLRCMEKQGGGVSTSSQKPLEDGVMIWIKKK